MKWSDVQVLSIDLYIDRFRQKYMQFMNKEVSKL